MKIRVDKFYKSLEPFQMNSGGSMLKWLCDVSIKNGEAVQSKKNVELCAFKKFDISDGKVFEAGKNVDKIEVKGNRVLMWSLKKTQGNYGKGRPKVSWDKYLLLCDKINDLSSRYIENDKNLKWSYFSTLLKNACDNVDFETL